VDGVVREQLEAPDVRAGDDGERLAGIHRDEERRREGQQEIRLAPCSHLCRGDAPWRRHIADVSEALHAQQLLGNVDWRDADPGGPHQANRRRFERPFVG
jgi:hypothetical protein